MTFSLPSLVFLFLALAHFSLADYAATTGENHVSHRRRAAIGLHKRDNNGDSVPPNVKQQLGFVAADPTSARSIDANKLTPKAFVLQITRSDWMPACDTAIREWNAGTGQVVYGFMGASIDNTVSGLPKYVYAVQCTCLATSEDGSAGPSIGDVLKDFTAAVMSSLRWDKTDAQLKAKAIQDSITRGGGGDAGKKPNGGGGKGKKPKKNPKTH